MDFFVIAVDVGGTFTDIVLSNLESGEYQLLKTFSTPADPSQGFLSGVSQLLGANSVVPGDIERILHGTTIATNAVLESKGADVGLIFLRDSSTYWKSVAIVWPYRWRSLPPHAEESPPQYGIGTSGTPIWRNNLTRHHIPTDEGASTMADVLKLPPFHLPRRQGQTGMFALQGLHKAGIY